MNKSRIPHKILGTVLLLFTVCVLSIRLGSTHMTTDEFVRGLLMADDALTFSTIIYKLRLPRMLAGLLAGVGLASSGTILQSITGNKMASPNIVGVNSGAGFAIILSLSLTSISIRLLPVAAFVGAFAATAVIILIASRLGATKTNVILTGIAFSSILSAGISLLSLLDTDVLANYNAFSIGSIAVSSSNQLLLPAIMIAFAFATAMFFAQRINVLSLGDSIAGSLGINVRATRIIAMLLASVLAGSAVSFAGLLGFVGLMSPHIARTMVGSNAKHLLPCSALCGSIIVLLADLLGRVIFAPSELPVGILMALIGAPFFLILLIKRGHNNDRDK